jgi:hypothetical protein
MVGKAFTPRGGQNVKYYKYIQLLWRHSKYQTKTLEAALKELFGSNAILFDQRNPSQLQHMPKVAVVTTTASGRRTYLHANYNARQHPGKEYQRWRPLSKKAEFYVWEA